MEILELKNMVTEIKAQWMGSTGEWEDERLSELEDETTEITQSEQ